MVRAVCAVPRCPNPAVHRGRCDVHRQSEEQRGYGRVHRLQRRDKRGAMCANCGCARNLQLDHRIPKSMGGTDDPRNKRWLCRCPEHGCHDKVGVRRDRPLRSLGIGTPSDTRAPFREGYS